ncbi:MAG: GNAT family N-acetyltransferase [Nitrospinae bacterium]|nr:GNAT family N-acetyltransferase [Nitrospinota bacterium]
MFRLENPDSQSFQKFLRAQGLLRVRFTEAIAEGGESLSLWVDDLAAPQVAVNTGRGWLAPLGRPEAILAKLEDMERLSAQMEESEGYLKLSSVPHEVIKAVERRRKLIRASPVGMFILEKKDFRPVFSTHRIESLVSEDAKMLAENSPYDQGEEYALARIRNAPTAAIRIGGELASYMVVHANGSIGMLHTMDRFRGQGLARVIVSALVEAQFARGREAYCYIVEGNEASERVFEAVGFRRVMDVYWSAFERGASSS